MDQPEPSTPPAPVPALPAPVDPAALRTFGDAALAALNDELSAIERATRSAMAPYDRQLRELRARSAEISTERRRRERSATYAARKAVREQAGSAGMPSLLDALAGTGEVDADGDAAGGDGLGAIPAFLKTGGQVQFGYATRPGNLTFTDGRRQRTVATLAEARSLYNDGWELGTITVPGVRIHMAGTRVERVVAADDVVIERPAPG